MVADSHPTSRRRFSETHLRVAIGATSILALLAVWEALAQFGWIDARLSSRPTKVWIAALDLLSDLEFWTNAGVSFNEFIWGLLAACVVGIPLGIGMGSIRRLRLFLEPTVMLFYTVPRVTFLPLIILWFGIGFQAYAVLVFLGALFPIIVNCMAGVRQIDPALVRAARSFGARPLSVFWLVLIPATMSFVMGGIRLGIGRGLIGIILGEMYFSVAGLGHMIMVYQAGLNTDKLMFLGFVVAISGVLMITGARFLENRLAPWRVTRVAD